MLTFITALIDGLLTRLSVPSPGPDLECGADDLGAGGGPSAPSHSPSFPCLGSTWFWNLACLCLPHHPGPLPWGLHRSLGWFELGELALL